jgi:hypothetical protein
VALQILTPRFQTFEVSPPTVTASTSASLRLNAMPCAGACTSRGRMWPTSSPSCKLPRLTEEQLHRAHHSSQTIGFLASRVMPQPSRRRMRCHDHRSTQQSRTKNQRSLSFSSRSRSGACHSFHLVPPLDEDGLAKVAQCIL